MLPEIVGLVCNEMGNSAYAPKSGTHFRYARNMHDFYKWADIVVTHAGAGTIFELLRMRKKTIAVPNLALVDTHQQDLAGKLSEQGYLLWCKNLEEIEKDIETAVKTKFKKYENTEANLAFAIKNKNYPWLHILNYAGTKKQKTGNYVVITPVRNEDKYVEMTIKSMIAQNVRPLRWVIVDDGSTDKTPEIISKYLNHKWITLVTRKDRGYRKLGGGVVDTFYDGCDALDEKEKQAEFIVKLDADLSFGAEYFEKILEAFSADERLGIASGQPYAEYDGGIRIERTNSEHARGPSKIYRMTCFTEIGGLIHHLGWDTVDEITAQMKGWKTKSLADIVYIHHRPTASSTGPWIKGKYREGYISYYLGYHPFYLLSRCVRQIFEKPRIIGAMFLFFGWLFSILLFKERHSDKELVQFLRKKQLQMIKGRVFK